MVKCKLCGDNTELSCTCDRCGGNIDTSEIVQLREELAAMREELTNLTTKFKSLKQDYDGVREIVMMMVWEPK